MNIIGKRNLYFLISFLVIIPGLISLLFFGLRLSIDFTGGTRLSFSAKKPIDNKTKEEMKDVFKKESVEVSTVQRSENRIFFRTTTIDQKKYAKIVEGFKKIGNYKEENYETVGPVVGQETTIKAIQSIVIASILIVLYIAWSFRHVPKPASSFRFGICAIIALLHDVLLVIGIFSLLGHFFHVEVDSLFVTAILTIIGFSVHDTIVVFDRLRENLRRMSNAPFETVANESILQTLGRSLNTSLTVFLVLFTLLLFGGESTKWFIVALLVGIISGTYSSIFNASPLLVVWEEWSRKRLKK